MSLPPALRSALLSLTLGLMAAAASAQPVQPAAPAPSAAEPPRTTAPSVSAGGQRVYEQARARLLQVRTLLRGQDSQSSVGSGFLVTAQGHLITNYHVVSQFALAPSRFRLVYVTADGRQGALELLAIDVVHDLALLKPADPEALAGRGALSLRGEDAPMQRGERIFAMGNPLDVGFAVLEGSYNGLVERAYLPTVFFGGSLSPGMSGGPALDTAARVVGINVASRRDGEQVSFLVPVRHAAELLERGRDAAALTQPLHAEVAQQLMAHQEALAARFLAEPWRSAGHARYRIPVPQENFMRCWGQSNEHADRGLQFERSDCTMDSRVFVRRELLTGYLHVRHEAYDGERLGALRFAHRFAASFGNEGFGRKTRWLTAPQCHERFVDRQGLPLRAVLCLRQHKKLEGLVDLQLLVATLDGQTVGAQGRFDAHGFSFDNAMRLAEHYLQGFAWTEAANASR